MSTTLRKKIVITGGLGFIGSHTVEHFHRTTEWDIVVLDRVSYASSGFERLRSADLLKSDRVRVFTWDLTVPLTTGLCSEIGTDVSHIVHMAADTHVDDSIRDPVPFVQNNVMSTVQMLEWARTLPALESFFYFSTDEVFGVAPEGTEFSEWAAHRPGNPYSASKSAAENLAISYQNSYGVPVMIVNVMNAFGERQHVEKFIPKTVQYVLAGRTLPIHAYPCTTKAGSRSYIHARNIAAAVKFLIDHGAVGEKYNVRGERELDNLEIALLIAKILGRELRYELVNFHADRPGHDLRYALDGSKMAAMGWVLPKTFEDSLRKTVEWTVAHPDWLESADVVGADPRALLRESSLRDVGSK